MPIPKKRDKEDRKDGINERCENTEFCFVCVHNSARSQMAEAWLNHLHGDLFEAQSADTNRRALNPLAVEVMRRPGLISLSRKPKAFLIW